MTRQNSLKRLVRARMAATGQSYTTARRVVLSQRPGEQFGGVVADGFLHLPGVHPECAALRVLLANSGVTAPHTGEPPSEALVFGIAGGAVDELLRGLQARVAAAYGDELAARDELRGIVVTPPWASYA